MSPVFVAAANGHGEVAETLLSWGASLTCKTQRNQTPMSVVFDGQHVAIARVLVRWGADQSAWGTSRTRPLRGKTLRRAVRDVTVLSEEERSSIVARNRSSVAVLSAVESSVGNGTLELTAAFDSLAAQPAAISWEAIKLALTSSKVEDLPSLEAAHRVLQLGVAAGVSARGAEAASEQEWCYQGVYLPVVGRLQPGESSLCRAIFAHAHQCGLLNEAHRITLFGLVTYDNTVQAKFASAFTRLDVLERRHDALCNAGARLYENVQQLRESLDQKERRRRKVAVATSCVKVGVSLIPLVGAALGSGAEAAICAAVDAACTESLATGSVVIRFYKDSGDLAAARDILSVAKDKLPAAELLVLENSMHPHFASLEDLVSQLGQVCASSHVDDADGGLDDDCVDAAPDGPGAGASGAMDGGSDGGEVDAQSTDTSQCDASSADGSVSKAADGVKDIVIGEAVQHGTEAAAGSGGTFQQDPLGAAPSSVPTPAAGSTAGTGTADLSSCTIDEFVGRLTDYVCCSFTPDHRAKFRSAVSTSAHRHEVDGLAAVSDVDPVGLAKCLLADYRDGALPRGPVNSTVAFLRRAQREWRGE